VGREQADRGVRDDGLGAFGQPRGEAQRALVAQGQTALLDQRGEAQQRDVVEQVGRQECRTRHARVGLGDRDADEEAAVDDEVGEEVEHPAEIRGARPTRDGAVEPVERPVEQPQDQRRPPRAGVAAATQAPTPTSSPTPVTAPAVIPACAARSAARSMAGA